MKHRTSHSFCERSTSRLATMNEREESNDCKDELLSQMISKGFDPVKAKEALEATGWNLHEAIGYLMNGNEDAIEDQNVIPMHHRGQEKDAKEISSLSPPHRNKSQHQADEKKKKLSSDADAVAKEDELSSEVPRPIPASQSSVCDAATRSPGAVAVPGVGGFSSSSRSVLRQADASRNRGSAADYDYDGAVLVGAELVSEPGPLVHATPSYDEDGHKRDIRRLYILACSAILLVIIVGVVVALVFVLGSNSNAPPDSSSTGTTNSVGDEGSIPSPTPQTTAVPTTSFVPPASEPPTTTEAPADVVSTTPEPTVDVTTIPPANKPIAPPTLQPSLRPTKVPTPRPSLRPTKVPTRPPTERPSNPPTPVQQPANLGEWEFCSETSQCLNDCCSNEYSDDGKLKCTPLDDGFRPDLCVTGTSLDDWNFCASSHQCLNGCCSKAYSDDGKLKCTPLDDGFRPDLCVV